MKKQTAQKKQQGMIFVISGPSGSGKTTLAGYILNDKTLKGKIKKSISFTTRPKRSCEKSGKDYFFVSESLFKRQLRLKKILEWTSYLGYYYGTPKSSLDSQTRQGQHILLCIDLAGAKNLRRLYPENVVTVFVMPPSLEELRDRMEKRCSKTKELEVRRRMRLAKKEMLEAGKFDYCLVNQDLKKTALQLKKIIIDRINRHKKR